MKNKKEAARVIRHKRLRRKVIGTKERPRLSLHRSLANIYVQFIDDISETTLCSVSTLDSRIKGTFKYGGNIKTAEALGKVTAGIAKSKGISKVVFDRGGYIYHGRIKAFAESARKHGLEF